MIRKNCAATRRPRAHAPRPRQFETLERRDLLAASALDIESWTSLGPAVLQSQDGALIATPLQADHGQATPLISNHGLSGNAADQIETSPPLVEFRLQATDLCGQPIDQVVVGEDFLLQIYVQDLRSEPAGVFAGYLDVTYDSAVISALGESRRFLDFGADYQNGKAGVLAAGLIDEAGAFAGIHQLLGGEHLLLTVSFAAKAPGVVQFVGDPADHRGHEALIYGEYVPVPQSALVFQGVQITVVAGTAEGSLSGSDQGAAESCGAKRMADFSAVETGATRDGWQTSGRSGTQVEAPWGVPHSARELLESPTSYVEAGEGEATPRGGLAADPLRRAVPVSAASADITLAGGSGQDTWYRDTYAVNRRRAFADAGRGGSERPYQHAGSGSDARTGCADGHAQATPHGTRQAGGAEVQAKQQARTATLDVAAVDDLFAHDEFLTRDPFRTSFRPAACPPNESVPALGDW